MNGDPFDTAPCGLVVCDGDGAILRANRFFHDLCGLAPQGRLFGKCLTRPAQFIFTAKLLPQLHQAGAADDVALTVSGPGGESVGVTVNARRVTTEAGEVQYHYAVFPAADRRLHEHDYSAAKKQLTQYRDYLRMAEKLARVGHWHVDLATRRVHWSPEIYSILGYDPQTFTPLFGETAHLYHPGDHDRVRAILEDAVKNGRDFAFRARMVRQDTGEARYIECTGVCERDDEGKVSGLFGVFHDITAGLDAQIQLERSEARYRLLAESSNDIIAILDLAGTLDYVSPAIGKVLGYTPEDMIGHNVRELIHPDDYDTTRAGFEAYVRSGDWAASPVIQYRGVHKDGHTVWLEASPRAMLDAHGRVINLQDVVRDISRRKAVEAALEKARVEANAAAEEKAQFLATMSHELRTPLTSIIGFSALLRDLLEDSDLRRHSHRIWTAGQGLMALINDILDHSKLESGQLDLDLAPCSPNDVACDVADLLDIQAQAKGLSLTVDVAEDMPQVLMDEVRLRQILLNLAGNAVKFTQDGGVTIALHWRGGSLRVCVTDTGPGIPPDSQQRLFKRFSQVDHTVGGTGLGLMICKQLVELMGGRIGVESSPGNGSLFWFEIPVEACESGIEDVEPVPVPGRSGGYLLIADDHAAIRDLLATLMRSQGYGVDTVTNGAEALKACLEQRYDLVLMDINMPVMDGLLAARGIRATSELNARTPILAITAGGDSRREACLRAGMNGMIDKPVRPNLLIRTVAELLAHAQEERHARLG